MGGEDHRVFGANRASIEGWILPRFRDEALGRRQMWLGLGGNKIPGIHAAGLVFCNNSAAKQENWGCFGAVKVLAAGSNVLTVFCEVPVIRASGAQCSIRVF